MIELTDQELVLRLQNFEDPFVERKTEGDFKDCLKTAVAFANTLPTGVPGVLFIPATNDGRIQKQANLDHLQVKISRTFAQAYPPIMYFQRILTVGEDQVLAILVWGSPARPHFAGPSYVRDGSQTKTASDQQFQELIARRSSKVEELSKWIALAITVDHLAPGPGPRLDQSLEAVLEGCNQWYITVKYRDPQPRNVERESITLERVHISRDHLQSRLKLEVHR